MSDNNTLNSLAKRLDINDSCDAPGNEDGVKVNIKSAALEPSVGVAEKMFSEIGCTDDVVKLPKGKS